MNSKLIKFLSIFILITLVGLFNLNKLNDTNNALIQENKNKYTKFITEKLRTGFDDKINLINSKRNEYVAIHRDIETYLANDKLSLQNLQSLFSEKLGYHIDLYKINQEYIITETTFDKDLYLDFKEPYFIDAQAALLYANKYDEISAGFPTLEITSGKFKTYTISQLKNGEFFEVGFQDPSIEELYTQIYNNLKHYPYVTNVELFLSKPSGTITPFSIHMVKEIDEGTKIEKLAKNAISLEGDTAIFATVNRQTSQMVEKNDLINLYIEAGQTKLTPFYPVRFLVKVTSDINFEKDLNIAD